MKYPVATLHFGLHLCLCGAHLSVIQVAGGGSVVGGRWVINT